jgi:hypothetical protein
VKIHIVFTERGTVYSVRKSITDAKKDKAELERRYENATIETFNVQ